MMIGNDDTGNSNRGEDWTTTNLMMMLIIIIILFFMMIAPVVITTRVMLISANMIITMTMENTASSRSTLMPPLTSRWARHDVTVTT